MADGIGRIFGGSNYSIGGHVPHRKEEDVPQQQASPTVNQEATQVDPSKVMEFMANNNFFVAPVKTAGPAELDAAAQERIAGYMENFEMIYSVIAKEFGHELAPDIMDYAMDYLMGMAA